MHRPKGNFSRLVQFHPVRSSTFPNQLSCRSERSAKETSKLNVATYAAEWRIKTKQEHEKHEKSSEKKRQVWRLKTMEFGESNMFNWWHQLASSKLHVFIQKSPHFSLEKISKFMSLICESFSLVNSSISSLELPNSSNRLPLQINWNSTRSTLETQNLAKPQWNASSTLFDNFSRNFNCVQLWFPI